MARDINVPESTLRGWIKNAGKLRYVAITYSSNNGITSQKLTQQITTNSTLASKSPSQIQAKMDAPYNFELNTKSMPFVSVNSFDAIDLSISNKDQGMPNYTQYEISTMHNIGKRVDDNNNPKGPLPVPPIEGATPLYYPNYQQMSGLNSLNSSITTSLPNCSSPLQQQYQPQSRISKLTSPQSPSSTVLLDDVMFSSSRWNKHKHSLVAKKDDNFSTSNVTMNNNLQSPVPKLVKTEMEYAVSSSTRSLSPTHTDKRKSPLTNILSDNNNNYVIVGPENYSDINGPLEAFKHVEKFFKWFETYSDPTITTQDLLQLERLVSKMKKIADRPNKSSLERSKVHSRK